MAISMFLNNFWGVEKGPNGVEAFRTLSTSNFDACRVLKASIMANWVGVEAGTELGNILIFVSTTYFRVLGQFDDTDYD